MNKFHFLKIMIQHFSEHHARFAFSLPFITSNYVQVTKDAKT